jgi:two-component system NtrC family sensor kinase
VSTNVWGEDGTRAVGTRISAEVYDHVLRRGRKWVGAAWVVDDWYISAYEPIYDVDRKPIGMLSVGVLAQKYRDLLISA